MEKCTQKKKDAFVRAVGFSILLHATLYLALIALPRHSPGLDSSAVLSVNLADLDISPRQNNEARPKPVTLPTEKIQEMAPPLPEKAELPPTAEKENPPAAAAPVVTETSPLALGAAHGFFRSLSDGHTLREDVRGYYTDLVEKVNANWWSAAAGSGVSPGEQETLVSIVMRKNGEIVAVRLMKSSGNPDYDRVVLEAVRSATPLPPLPESYAGEYFQAPLRLVAPLRLFNS